MNARAAMNAEATPAHEYWPDGSVKQFRADAVFPAKVKLDPLPGESVFDHFARESRANAGWNDAYTAALNDPRNMTTAYLARRLHAHRAMKAAMGGLPWAGAREAFMQEPEWVAQYAAELEIRRSGSVE